MHPSISEARGDDLADINEIYNRYVLNTTATFHEQLVSTEDRQAWWREHANRFPVLVADTDDQVLGWAALSPQSGRCAFVGSGGCARWVSSLAGGSTCS